MRLGPALAALCLLLPAARAEEPVAAPHAAQRQVDGSVAEVDLQRHQITVTTGGGAVAVGWDRNTLIYLPGGATTALALKPGVILRAGVDPGGTAYWIQLRPVPRPADQPPGTATVPAPAGP